MLNKIESIVYFILLIVFFIFIFFYYFSEENTGKIMANRINITENINKETLKIPVLKNDTNDIIEYTFSTVDDKKNKKRFFWNLLKDNE